MEVAMIGQEAIRAASLSSATRPEADEILGVDTDALTEWAMVVGQRVAPQAAGDELWAALAAVWAQGFMAGVLAEQNRTDGRPGA